ncbi:MAG: exo-alpha-sialidase, partial [Alcaligenaceae bacterium]|nr:exo-alpha-sialidase [Alcaligenaceae bacterium]
MKLSTEKITNLYNANNKRPKLQTEKVYIYQPERDWSYSHHASITFFKEKFYAIWSNGRINEDDLGQRVLISSSENFYDWTEPKPLIDSKMGKHSEVVLTAAGFHQYQGTLVAYYGQYEYKPDNIENGACKKLGTGHMDTSLFAVTTTDGRTWSEPINMNVPIVPNHGPQRIASGRLIISGNIMYPYTDDPTGLSGWQQTGIYPADWVDVYDDSEGFILLKERMGWETGLCEGSFYQTPDGVIHMLLRSGTR